MPHQDQGAGGGRWAREPAITQADRGRWQLQAAAVLEHLAKRHVGLPAIYWHLTRAGDLRGHVGSEVPPGEARRIFTVWSTALALDDVTGLPGSRGGLARAHGQACWGSVPVSVTASVPPAGSGGAVLDVDRGSPPGPAMGWVKPAVGLLAGTLGLYRDIDAASWLVRPSGSLSARVAVPGSPREAACLFRRWREALGLGGYPVTAARSATGTGLRAEGHCTGIPVTLEAMVTTTSPGRGAGLARTAMMPDDAPGPGSRAVQPAGWPGAAGGRLPPRLPRQPPPHGSGRPGPAPRPW
jgi:hypothetical protein